MLIGIPESLHAQENSSLKSPEEVSLWSSVETLRFITSFLNLDNCLLGTEMIDVS